MMFVLDNTGADTAITEIVLTYDGSRQRVVARGPTMCQEIIDWKMRIDDEWLTKKNSDYSYRYASFKGKTTYEAFEL